MKTDRLDGNGAGAISVVVTGSECTGKTTLAQALATEYAVECVPEFVRDFVARMGGRPQFSDHGPIARGQMALEDEYRARAAGLVVHDTDLLSTAVYCRHFFGRCPEWIEAAASDRRAPLYLLCDIDVPWIPDGLRDRGDRRAEMHDMFASMLTEIGAKSVLLSGDHAHRLAVARTHVDQLLS